MDNPTAHMDGHDMDLAHAGETIGHLEKQRDELLAALKEIRDQLREHPTYLGDDCTDKDLGDVGGDSAFITWNCHIANSAIAKADGLQDKEV